MPRSYSVFGLPRDRRTGEVHFMGRWYTEEEYLELRENMERDEDERKYEAEDHAGDKEREESWAA